MDSPHDSSLSARSGRQFCTENLLELKRRATERLHLSARAYDRVLRVARTIADLAGADAIESPHLAEAIHYREVD